MHWARMDTPALASAGQVCKKSFPFPRSGSEETDSSASQDRSTAVLARGLHYKRAPRSRRVHEGDSGERRAGDRNTEWARRISSTLGQRTLCGAHSYLQTYCGHHSSSLARRESSD